MAIKHFRGRPQPRQWQSNTNFRFSLRTVTDIKLSTAPGRSPFFHRFGPLARGKVISVTVLKVRANIRLPTWLPWL